MNNTQNQKCSLRSITVKKCSIAQDIRRYLIILNTISTVAFLLLLVTLFIAGISASIATGPFALLLLPIIFVAVALFGFVCVICMLFFNSMINAYAATVENIQTITDIVTEKHTSNNADTNERVTSDNITSAE